MKEKKKIQLASTDTCTGCGACVQSCAKGAISMIEDREGFLQPHINQKLCVGCHKCEQTCPIISPIAIPQNFETKVYAAINKDEAVRMRSSSGGVFHALAKWTIEQGGVVFGARFDDNWEVMHDYTETIEGIEPFMRSKYVQSRVGDTYKQAKKFLNKDRWVLYSGTPCQIGGLYKFLGKDYEKLIMVDLICHGVPSPGVWRKYLKEATKEDKILNINFRDKADGWSAHQCMVTTITTATTTRFRLKQHPFFRSFRKDLILRTACYSCQYRSYHRMSDITIADYWGVDQLCPEMFDNRGTSIVFSHTKKGELLVNNLSQQVRLMSQMKENAIMGNSGMDREQPKKQPFKRRLFYLIFRKSFMAAIKLIDKLDAILEKMKCLTKKILRKVRPSYWSFNYREYKSIFDYDLKFNASFRNIPFCTKVELKMPEFLYLKLYRKTQVAKGTFWFHVFYRRLVKMSRQTGIGLCENLNIPKGLIIGHTGTIVINGNANFKGNVMLTHGVTIGRDIRGKRQGTPTFGKNVCIRCNSTVVGGITIGEDVLIAPNTFVNFDVPSHSIVIGNPATIHHRENATEGHIGYVNE